MDLMLSNISETTRRFLVIELKKQINISSEKNKGNIIKLLDVLDLSAYKLTNQFLFAIAYASGEIGKKDVKLYIPVIYVHNGELIVYIDEFLKDLGYNTKTVYYNLNFNMQSIYFYIDKVVNITTNEPDFNALDIDINVYDIILTVKNEPYILDKNKLAIKSQYTTNKKYEGMIKGLTVFEGYFIDIYLPCMFSNNELTIYNYNETPYGNAQYLNINSQTIYFVENS